MEGAGVRGGCGVAHLGDRQAAAGKQEPADGLAEQREEVLREEAQVGDAEVADEFPLVRDAHA